MATMTPQQLQQRIDSGQDPGLIAAIRDDAAHPFTRSRATNAYLKSQGLTVDGYHINQAGQVVKDEGLGGIWKPLVIGGAALATAGLAAPALAGGGAAAGAGGGAAAAGGGTAAGAGTAAAGAGAAAASKSIWDKISGLSPLIQAGTGIAGAAIAAHGATSAADTAAAAADRARQTQIDLFNLEQGQLSPYRSAGQAAIGQLAYGFGVPGFEGGPTSHAAPPMPTLPGGTTNFASLSGPAGSASSNGPVGLSTFAAPGSPLAQAMNNSPEGQRLTAISRSTPNGIVSDSGGMVTVKSPNGQVGQIPANRLNDALAAGGQQVMS